MSDKDVHRESAPDQSRDRDRDDRRDAFSEREHRSWSGDEGQRDPRAGGSPYGRIGSGVDTASRGGFTGGGYGDQGGFGSQHGQGGYASPAQGSRYGQTGSEWGRSGYGSASGERTDPGRSYGGGQAGGFGATSYGAEEDRHRDNGRGDDPRERGGGSAPWGGRDAYGQGGDDRLAQRSTYRRDTGQDAGAGAPESRFGTTGGDRHDHDDHEPHYRNWRDQQLAGHDRDYERWRKTQSQRYDDDYRRYRDERHDSFSRSFGDWRNQSAQSVGSTTDGRAQPSTSEKPVGSNAVPPAGDDVPITASDDSLRSVTDGRAHKPADDHKEDRKPDEGQVDTAV